MERIRYSNQYDEYQTNKIFTEYSKDSIFLNVYPITE
ncbi:hypothetical protein CLV75_0667 [Ruegeria conchae]|uniref:Uncharacterized protein n=1 Tax=Ruegeria conchae TaxID=981384 RepID=A0A497ZMN6_9RHOB|nr:hypothetical protein CLV75_0667 [Ruegeria conchae]